MRRIPPRAWVLEETVCNEDGIRLDDKYHHFHSVGRPQLGGEVIVWVVMRPGTHPARAGDFCNGVYETARRLMLAVLEDVVYALRRGLCFCRQNVSPVFGKPVFTVPKASMSPAATTILMPSPSAAWCIGNQVSFSSKTSISIDNRICHEYVAASLSWSALLMSCSAVLKVGLPKWQFHSFSCCCFTGEVSKYVS